MRKEGIAVVKEEIVGPCGPCPPHSAPSVPQGRAAAAAAAVVARPATPPRLLVAIMTRVGAPDLLSGGACSSWRAMARDQAGDWVALTFGRRTARLGHSNSWRTRTHRARRHPGGRHQVGSEQIKAVPLPEFADEDHLLFLADVKFIFPIPSILSGCLP